MSCQLLLSCCSHFRLSERIFPPQPLVVSMTLAAGFILLLLVLVCIPALCFYLGKRSGRRLRRGATRRRRRETRAPPSSAVDSTFSELDFLPPKHMGQEAFPMKRTDPGSIFPMSVHLARSGSRARRARTSTPIYANSAQQLNPRFTLVRHSDVYEDVQDTAQVIILSILFILHKSDKEHVALWVSALQAAAL